MVDSRQLAKSHEHWQAATKHDRNQFLGSVGILGLGLGCAGIGIGTLVSGDLGGVAELMLGTGLAFLGVEDVVDSVRDFMHSRSRATAIEQKILR